MSLVRASASALPVPFSNSPMYRHLLSALVFVALALPLAAHDFWIEPATFRPALDTRVALELRVGENFAGDEVPRRAEKIESFVSWNGGVSTPVAGIEERTPAGIFRARSTGVTWIAYRSRTTAIELEAVKFENYLREEGLDHVVLLRDQRGETALPGKERYSRCAKALLVVQGAPGDNVPHAGFDQVLGLTLEIVPVNDPATLRPGDTLTVRVLHAGKPLANALVGLRAKVAAEHETRVRTDAEGRVAFTLAASGATLLRVVHMARAQAGSGADWESWWASLSCDVLPRATAPEPEPPPAPAPAPPPAPRAPAD